MSFDEVQRAPQRGIKREINQIFAPSIYIALLVLGLIACDDTPVDQPIEPNAGAMSLAGEPVSDAGELAGGPAGDGAGQVVAGASAGDLAGDSAGGLSGEEAGELAGEPGGESAGEPHSVDLARGEALYEQYCGFCHGSQGEGYLADNANALNNPEFLSVATDEFLKLAIIHGRPGTPMSPWGVEKGGPLDEGQTLDIVAYVRTWQTTESITPPPLELEGSAQRGAPLYQAVCASCHGAEGEGVSAVSLNNPWFLHTVDDAFIAHAITEGRSGTAMGAYGPPLVNAQGLADLVALIRSWALPVDTDPPPPFVPQVDRAPLNPEGPEPNFELREDRFVPAAQVYEALESGARLTLIDARPAADYLDEHISGAISLPFYDIERYASELPSDAFTVTYCGCPHAVSGQAADALIALGFERVAILDEGFYEWRDTFGYPTRGGVDP